MAETDGTAQQDGVKKAPAGFRDILGEKIGMTQIYHPKRKNLCDVTMVKAGPCAVLRVKTAEGRDGYNAVQLAYGARKEKNLPKSLLGQFKKAGAAPARYVREIRVKDAKGLEAGQTVLVNEIFKIGDYVDVHGVSKGHGFAGVMKRHNFRGLPASHGASDKQRSPGSLAARRSLGRVLPGQRMAGHMGHEGATSQHLEVIKVEPEQNLIYVMGSVPGARGSLVSVSETAKGRKFRAEPAKAGVKKDKMGNIIGKAPTKAKKA
ncbi:MAG TPA: 50S ribosomal protein L3 [Elusimicrobiota bacterium]|nr:50S ribosomal protein L3 [Elusimicrobiota bacterium]